MVHLHPLGVAHLLSQILHLLTLQQHQLLSPMCPHLLLPRVHKQQFHPLLFYQIIVGLLMHHKLQIELAVVGALALVELLLLD